MRTLMIVLFLGVTFLVGNNASRSEDVETEPPFVATQASGQVRVTLVEVSQRGFFTSTRTRSGVDEKPARVPWAYVEMVVEYLGENAKPVPNVVAPAFRFSRNGVVIAPREGVPSGGHDGVYEYRDKHGTFSFPMPKVADPKRSHVRKVLEAGIDLPEGTVDMSVRLGFDGQLEEFVFKNVPVD